MSAETSSDQPMVLAHDIVLTRRSARLTADEREAKRTRALATLRQDIWEAAQWAGLTELERFCGGVVDEIRSDEP